MEKEEKNPRVWKAPESEFLLQWGKRKRLRGPRVKDFEFSDKSNGGIRRKITSRIHRLLVTASSEKENSHFLQPTRFTRNCEGAVLRSNAVENRKSRSPEKEDRYYTMRGSVGGGCGGGGENENENVKILSREGEDRGGVVWPKLYITLSSKEKEEDFLAMKGCKPPQRPKKRAKLIQRSLLLVSPGAWLSDMSHERYEVREKKTAKKRPRGLKAMGSMESDSE